ncbi:histidine phosphotransferase family protein [Rhodophyticola porphyridii]|uniref:histidine phosphotransferase family protein n=1 Tax=Rhodophyticola porphyridii TaxID=1852017 RepID=UPI0035CFB825
MDDRKIFPPEDLAALVGSRLCHDLVNPLAAIGNGVELLAMTGSADGPEMALTGDAVKDAQARIRFFRIAFGAAGAEHEISRRETDEILTALFATGRLRVTWHPDTALPRIDVKLAFLMLNCTETALPMGGTVEIRRHDEQLELVAEGPRVNADRALWQLLEHPGQTTDVRAAEVQFPLLRDAAFGVGRAPRVTIGDAGLTITL